MHDRVYFFDDLGTLTLSNKKRYAARHGYEMVVHVPEETSGLYRASDADCTQHAAEMRHGACYEPANRGFQNDDRAATFGKIKLARAACVGRDGYWLLWSDADAMIINQTMPLTQLIDDRFDMMISVDWLMINAGVILIKCSRWMNGFLKRVYDDDEFDEARALDQSALQHYLDNEEGAKQRVKFVPKRLLNVYVEEYVPGDFLLHMAGKLYESTVDGANAIANQFDVLSTVDHVDDIAAFFQGRYLLGMYSGVCVPDEENGTEDCSPEDERRLKLKEPLIAMSVPNRYRHVLLRYSWMDSWEDKYDVPGWDDGRVVFDPQSDGDDDDTSIVDNVSNDTVDQVGTCTAGAGSRCNDDDDRDEL